MAAKLLIYHMEEARIQALEGLCEALGIQPVRVDETSHQAPVGLLTGTADPRKLMSSAAAQVPSAPIDEEMIVMSDFTEKQFHALLDTLRESAFRIGLKAVETPVNMYWTGEMLQTELKNERQAYQ